MAPLDEMAQHSAGSVEGVRQLCRDGAVDQNLYDKCCLHYIPEKEDGSDTLTATKALNRNLSEKRQKRDPRAYLEGRCFGPQRWPGHDHHGGDEAGQRAWVARWTAKTRQAAM